MLYFSLSALINAITSLILGVFVLWKNPKDKINRSFFYFCFSVFIWSFGYYFWQISKDSDTALFWLRLLTFGSALIPLFYLYFSLVFAKKERNKGVAYFFIISIILALLSLTNYLVVGVGKKLIFNFWPIPGALYPFLLLVFFAYTIYSSVILYIEYKNSSGLRKEQLKYILFGFIVGFIGGSTNFLLWYNIPFLPIGNILVSVYVLATTYAIIRYRFMDIRVVIKRSAIFTILVLLITSIYALFTYLVSIFFQGIIGTQSVIVNGVITAVLVALGFEPLKKFLSQITDTFLFKAEYNPQQVLGEFSDKLSSTLNLDELTQFLVKKTSEVFKCTKSSLYLFNPDHQEYQEKAMWGKRSVEPMAKIEPKLFNKIFSYLKQIGKAKDVIVREEIKKINEQYKNQVLNLLIKQLDEREVNLIVPFYVKEELIGILFLGDKKSGDVYSQQDLNVLEIIAGQSAVSIQNAGLFEEQKHFAEHLKREVDKATKELQIANVQLRKLDKAKSEFISIASHQLRTPLTVIRGYISMIEQGDFGIVSHKVQEPLDRVYKSTMRIIGLVEDLLNISRIESGRLKYDFKPTDLPALVADVYEELKQQAKNKSLQFEFIKPTKEIPQLVLDQGKIRETIMNLIDNSIKYTDAGFVRVKLERDDDHVTLSVSDSGRGLAPDEIPLLFQKFSRAKGAQLMHTEGTGLGLYIAKNIIAKHGGKIWVESPGTGKGSTFYIRFRINNKRLEK